MPKLRIHFRLVLIIYWFLSLHTCCCLARILRCSLLYINWIISLCCQCLWIVHSWLSFRFSLTFIFYYWQYIPSYVHIHMFVKISTSKRCSVRFCLHLFVPYLRHLCLFAYSGVRHVLCCVFLSIVYSALPVSWDCPFFFALRYSLTFIINITIIQNHQKQCLD